MENSRYEIQYMGNSLNTDTSRVKSDCNRITFLNLGDTPVTVTGSNDSGMDIKFVLAGKTATKTDYVQFGQLSPEYRVRMNLDITFDALVTTKNLAIMREKLVLE